MRCGVWRRVEFSNILDNFGLFFVKSRVGACKPSVAAAPGSARLQKPSPATGCISGLVRLMTMRQGEYVGDLEVL